MKYIKFLFILLFFVFFFIVLNHYQYLESYKFDLNKETIPIIEPDSEPYRILAPADIDNDPLKESCTLNDEC